MKGNWGSYSQGGDSWERIDQAGTALSSVLSCHVIHYHAFNKRLFECKCGIIFPAWMVEAATMTNDWSLILQKHGGVEAGTSPTPPTIGGPAPQQASQELPDKA